MQPLEDALSGSENEATHPTASTSTPAQSEAAALLGSEREDKEHYTLLPDLDSQTQLDQLEAYILSQREEAKNSQMKQAQRMIQRSKIVLSNADIGDNIAIPMPHVDRGKADPKNLLGVVIDRDENLMYTVATKSGVLKGKYSRNQFNLCPVRLLTTGI